LKIAFFAQVVDDNNVTFELVLTASDHGQPPRSTAAPLTVVLVVSRFASSSSHGTSAGRRRAGPRLLDGWVPVAIAAACGVGLVLLCTVLAVSMCVLRRRRRNDCSKHHPNADAAASVPLTGKYNCRVESLKVVGVGDTREGLVLILTFIFDCIERCKLVWSTPHLVMAE